MRVLVHGVGPLAVAHGAALAGAGVVVRHRRRQPSGPPLARLHVRGLKITRYLPVLADDDFRPAVHLVVVPTTALDAVVATLHRDHAPVVSVTPLFPEATAHLEGTLGPPTIAAMPGLVVGVAATGETVGVRGASLRLERTPGAVGALARVLRNTSVGAVVDPDVGRRNLATTVRFLPWTVALALDDDPTTWPRRCLAGALRECGRLAATLGPIEPWAAAAARLRPEHLDRLLHGANRLIPGLGAVLRHHYGRKMTPQTVALARETLDLGRNAGVPMDDLTDLTDALLARSSRAAAPAPRLAARAESS